MALAIPRRMWISSGVGEPLTDAFLQVDLATHTFLRVAVTRRDDCPDCGRRTL